MARASHSRATLDERTKYERTFLKSYFYLKAGFPDHGNGYLPMDYRAEAWRVDLVTPQAIGKTHRLFGSYVSPGGYQSLHNSLLPLAFLSAFKLQDMIIEWLLHVNKIKTNKAVWGFKDKVDLVGDAIRSHSLRKPIDFCNEPSLIEPFYQMYKRFRASRNTMIHSHSFEVKMTQSNNELHFDTNEGLMIMSERHINEYVAFILYVFEFLNGGIASVQPGLVPLIRRSIFDLKELHRFQNVDNTTFVSVQVEVPNQFPKSIDIKADLLPRISLPGLPRRTYRYLILNFFADQTPGRPSIFIEESELNKHSQIELSATPELTAALL